MSLPLLVIGLLPTSMLSFSFSAGMDYTSVAVMLTFSVSNNDGYTQCVNIPLLDDVIFEMNEHFYVRISSEVDVVIHRASAPVHIIDNDGEFTT